jgi:hypothetical protein
MRRREPPSLQSAAETHFTAPPIIVFLFVHAEPAAERRSGSSRHHFGATDVGKSVDLRRQYMYQYRGAVNSTPGGPLR